MMEGKGRELRGKGKRECREGEKNGKGRKGRGDER